MSHYVYYWSIFTFTAVKSPITPCDSKLFCSKCRRSDRGLSYWIFFKWTNESNLDEMSKRFTRKHVSIREHQEPETTRGFLTGAFHWFFTEETTMCSGNVSVVGKRWWVHAALFWELVSCDILPSAPHHRYSLLNMPISFCILRILKSTLGIVVLLSVWAGQCRG